MHVAMGSHRTRFTDHMLRNGDNARLATKSASAKLPASSDVSICPMNPFALG
jgi:hypothetical protein